MGRRAEIGGNGGNEPQKDDQTKSVSDLFDEFVTPERWKTTYYYAISLTHNVQEAEDITQEAFERLGTALQTRTVSEIREMNLPAYLNRIVYRLCIKLLGRRKKEGPAAQQQDREEGEHEVADESAFGQPEREVLEAEGEQELVTWLGKIPETMRIVLEEHYFYNLSTPEIAEKYGRPLNTVKNQLSRGINLLRVMVTQNPMKEKRSTSGE